MNLSLRKTFFWFLFIITACVISSCKPLDVTSSEDKIGPKPKNEPNALEAAAKSIKPEKKATPAGPLQITITEALLMAMENNSSLLVQRFSPQIQRTFEREEMAVFDPDLLASISQSEDKTQSIPRPGLGSRSATSREFLGSLSLQEFFPTGTTLGVIGSTDLLKGSFLSQPFDSSRLGLTATQSLLRGFGPKVNLATVNQAKIDTKISQYELRGFAELLAAQTEEAYWNYALAEKKIKIYEDSLELAQKQQQETEERIKIGKLAQSELAAAQAEVALRKENLINARSNLVQMRINLLRLLNPGTDNFWNSQVVIKTAPVSPAVQIDDIEPHVQLALLMRPELNQAKLQLQKDELELIKTRNGLLPQLDLFITLGKTGFSDSFSGSVRRIDGPNYDWIAGFNFEMPPLNRAAKVRDTRAIITRNQAKEAIKNLAQLVEVDVQSAYEEILRAKEQVTATEATRKLQEEKMKVETEKLNVGKSTSLLVAQAQRDYLSSQIDEVSAVVAFLNGFVELYRLEGSLLERRGIACPGKEPVNPLDLSEL